MVKRQTPFGSIGFFAGLRQLFENDGEYHLFTFRGFTRYCARPGNEM